MIVKHFFTKFYLWLIFVALTNGQYPGLTRNIYSFQSQPSTNPLTGGRQNSFAPGAQFPNFNSNQQVTSPQNIPQVFNSQKFPQVINPRNIPQAVNLQNLPQVTNSQNTPQGIKPQSAFQAPSLQNIPQVANLQNFPQINNPQNIPQVRNPQNFPRRTNSQNFPQVNNPQSPPRGSNPQNFPQAGNSQSIPQAINPRNIFQATNPQNNPQVTNRQTFPQGINSQNFPQVMNPRNIPQTANPRTIPQMANPRNIPQMANPRNIPQMANPRNIPQTTNPRNIPQAMNSQNIHRVSNPQNNPQVAHFGSSPTRNSNIPDISELIRSIFNPESRFNPRPVNRQTSFPPSNAAPYNPSIISQRPSSSFITPQQTGASRTGTQVPGPVFTNPQTTGRHFTNPQQIRPFIYQPINPSFIAPQQASPSNVRPQQVNPISDSQQINRDSTSPQKTNSDSIVTTSTISESTIPVPTNSDSTLPMSTNSDFILPMPTDSDSALTNSDTTAPPPTNSDLSVTQQDNSLSTVPQQMDSDSKNLQKTDTTLEDTQPITSASEISSSVTDPKNSNPLPIAPENSGQPPHNRGTKYRANSGEQANPQAKDDSLNGLRIVCLFNNKHYMTSNFAPANIDPSLCTHINYEFAILDPQTYEMMIGEPDLDIEMNFYVETIHLKKVNPDLKVLVSLGGWMDSTKKYSELADDPSKRQNFVIKAVEFLKKHGFDGLDFAWEYPNCWQGAIGVSPKDKQNFVDLLKEMKQEFGKNGLLLSVSVGAIKREVEAAYDVPEISKYVDYINVMTYDMHGPWEPKTSHHVQFEAMPDDDDPYCNVKGGMQVWIEKGANKKKLNMGLAFYGRTFTMESSDQCAMGVPAKGVGKAGSDTGQGGLLSYSEICNLLNSGNWTEKQDKHAGFFACSEDQWAGYDPPMMMVRKVKYVVESGLGGVLLKDLSGDDFKGKCFSMPFPLLRMVKMEMIHRAMQQYS